MKAPAIHLSTQAGNLEDAHHVDSVNVLVALDTHNNAHDGFTVTVCCCCAQKTW